MTTKDPSARSSHPKQGEEGGDALPKGVEWFRAIAEQVTDLIALTDAEGVITFASPACRALLQYAPEEMCGRHFTEFLEESAVPTALAAFRKGRRRGELAKNLELRMKRKDDSTFVGELNGSKLRVGEEQGALVIIRDVTERAKAEEALRESEDRYRKLVSLSPDAITVGVDGK